MAPGFEFGTHMKLPLILLMSKDNPLSVSGIRWDQDLVAYDKEKRTNGTSDSGPNGDATVGNSRPGQRWPESLAFGFVCQLWVSHSWLLEFFIFTLFLFSVTSFLKKCNLKKEMCIWAHICEYSSSWTEVTKAQGVVAVTLCPPSERERCWSSTCFPFSFSAWEPSPCNGATHRGLASVNST